MACLHGPVSNPFGSPLWIPNAHDFDKYPDQHHPAAAFRTENTLSILRGQKPKVVL